MVPPLAMLTQQQGKILRQKKKLTGNTLKLRGFSVAVIDFGK